MRHLRRAHRVPLLLCGCLVTALCFPRACADTRAGLGALLPATAPLTAAAREDPLAAAQEDRARLLGAVVRLSEDAAARAAPPGSPVSGVPVSPASGADPGVAVQADVLHRDASSTRLGFLVGAGRDDGLYPGLPVVHGGSLCGIVSSVATRSARVVRIDDPGTACVLPAVILGTAPGDGAVRRSQGVVRGAGPGRLRVAFLPPDAAAVGDLVVCGPGRYPIPEGLVLGRVTAFDDDDRDGAWEAEVTPLRDLDTLGSVLVLRREPLELGDPRR